MYMLANTTVSILRGGSVDEYGDAIDGNMVAVYHGILANITSPGQSPLRPIILGTSVNEDATPGPFIKRLIECILPAGTDVTVHDQVLDERANVTYEVHLVTQQGNVGGLNPDLIVTLKRVDSVEHV